MTDLEFGSKLVAWTRLDKMSRIWILVLSFATSGLAQSSSDATKFLISAPMVLHAGTPTPLAVTVYADFAGKVAAEVVHGNTKISETETFQGGVTKVLLLPPLPDWIPHNSLLKLKVTGYKEDKLIFTNTTTVSFSIRNVSSVIQINKSVYKPGDSVKIRVVSIQLDNRPYKGKMTITVKNPSGSVAGRWDLSEKNGIFLQEFALPQGSPLGQWMISTTVNNGTDNKVFIVKQQEAPQFEVLVKTSSRILVGDDISGSVRALYPTGQPVLGQLEVSASLGSAASGSSATQLTHTKNIYGSTQFFFSGDQLRTLLRSVVFPNSSSPVVVHIFAHVHDNLTESSVSQEAEVHLLQNSYELKFLNFPQSLKPSLHFSTKLQITKYSKEPLSPEDLLNPVVVKVNQKLSTGNLQNTTFALPVPEDGNVVITFQLQGKVVMCLVTATFQSSMESLQVFTNSSSPSNSYIQISQHDTPAQIGAQLQLNVESTFKLSTLHFVVSSGGRVVAAGTKNSSSFSLTPDLSWSPQACVTVYALLSNGELISDTAFIPIQKYNLFALSWSGDKAHPGEQLSLTVTSSESTYQVGIVVLRTNAEILQTDLNNMLEQVCNINTITNVVFTQKMQQGEIKSEVDLFDKYWSLWMDTSDIMLWFDSNVSEKKWSSEKITVPDGVSSLRAVAMVMSDNMGLAFTHVPQQMAVSKDFSLTLDVPPYLIRGEEIILEANIINHLEHNIEVIVLLAQSENFKFVLSDRKGVSVINAQQLAVKSHASAVAYFPIRPLVLGKMEVSVDAVSAEASDSLARSLLVKPEGVEQSVIQTLFLEMGFQVKDKFKSVSFSFPPHVVPGSQTAYMALAGDILGLSIDNLESLVRVPTGCGEQNMINFAPSLSVLQYLDNSGQDNGAIRSRALGFMSKGYERQLYYQRDDGSFSAFGKRDTSGSTWLTAFVLRCFLQAQLYINVNQELLTRAITWLLAQQAPQGQFVEKGRVIHTKMQGGLDDDSVALTAFVLLAFLEAEDYTSMYASNVSLGVKYLESKLSSGGVSNYSLCLMAYALSLKKSSLADRAISQLLNRADYKDGVMTWTSTSSESSVNLNTVRSAQIEMASYVLLALFVQGRFIEGIALMKWLSTQRHHLGGFGSTQDTVVALQALAYYAAFSGSSAIDLKFNVSSTTSSFVSLFRINSTNYRAYQDQKIDAEKDLPLNIDIDGGGFALFQLNVFYNLESNAYSQILKNDTDKEAFLLDLTLADTSNNNQMTLSICTRLKDNQKIITTGMVVVEVGILSGFGLSPEATFPSDLIKNVEQKPEKVILYLDSVSKTEVCIKLPIVRKHKVALVQDGMVHVYDYYEPTRKAARIYNSKSLRSMQSCSFCGQNCDLCRPGISIIVDSGLKAQATSNSIYCLGTLLLGAVSSLILL